MLRNLTVAVAAVGLVAGIAVADHHMMGEPPMHPEVILGPPEGFMPPPDMEPPMPSGDPEADKMMVLDHFFRFMDANGDGVIDMTEFRPWVRGAHMPPPGMMEHEGMPGRPGEGMGPGRKGMGPGREGMGPGREGMGPGREGMGPGREGMGRGPGGAGMPGMTGMDGMLRAGEGDLAGLSMAPECSDELREAEMLPQAENVPCGERQGNLIFRTICNMPGYESAAISLPDGRAAGCFGLEALRGAIAFEIVTEDGMHVWDTTMGKEAFRGLRLDGPGIYHIRSMGGAPDGAVTVRFVDVPAGM